MTAAQGSGSSETTTVATDRVARERTVDQEDVDVRDPFWPVGFAPPRPEEPAPEVAETVPPDAPVEVQGQDELDLTGLTAEERQIIRSHVRVDGILVQRNVCTAMINKQLVRAGDEIPVDTVDRKYRFRVRELTTKRIVLESVNQDIR